MPKISVVMPAYNIEDYIEETIRSVINQEFQDWELLVVDDGSEDSTLEKVKKLAEKDARIKMILQAHEGVSTARNKGIDQATGEYISFLDSDDLWDKTFLSKMLNLIQCSKKEFVLAGYNRLLPSGKIRQTKNKFDVNDDILYNYSTGEFKTHVGALLIDKKALRKSGVRFTDGCGSGEDIEFLYKTLISLNAIVLPEALMLYRRRKGSASRKKWDYKNEYTCILALERSREFFKSANKDADRYNKVLNKMQKQIAFSKAHYSWRLVKYGKVDLLDKYLQEGWRKDIKFVIDSSDISKVRMVKYKIVLSENKILWNYIYMINKLVS